MVDPRVIHVMIAVEQLDEVCQALIGTFWMVIVSRDKHCCCFTMIVLLHSNDH